MFAKPTWFRPKRRGWGLVPASRQGWLYGLAWCGILAVPFVVLMLRGQVLEALLWQAAAIAYLLWEVKQVLACYRVPSPTEQARPRGEESAAISAPESEIEFLDETPTERDGQWFSRHFHFCPRR